MSCCFTCHEPIKFGEGLDLRTCRWLKSDGKGDLIPIDPEVDASFCDEFCMLEWLQEKGRIQHRVWGIWMPEQKVWWTPMVMGGNHTFLDHKHAASVAAGVSRREAKTEAEYLEKRGFKCQVLPLPRGVIRTEWKRLSGSEDDHFGKRTPVWSKPQVL